MSENDNASSDNSTESAANDGGGMEMAANDIGGFEASISASDPQGALSATETHDTPNADPGGTSNTDPYSAGAAATETSAGEPFGSPGSLDLAAPTNSVADKPVESDAINSVGLSDLIAVLTGGAGIAFAASRQFGKAAAAVAANNPVVQQGVTKVGTALEAGAEFSASHVNASPFDIVQQFATSASPVSDMVPSAPVLAALPVSSNPVFTPPIVYENTSLLLQIGFVPNG